MSQHPLNWIIVTYHCMLTHTAYIHIAKTITAHFLRVAGHQYVPPWHETGEFKQTTHHMTSHSEARFRGLCIREITLKYELLITENNWTARLPERRCCVQISWNFVEGKSVKSCVIYPTKNYGCLSELSLLRGSRPKFAWVNPQQCTHSAPDFIKIGSVSAEV